jgi:nondiscriminating glutamyl-tRNA synthetase
MTYQPQEVDKAFTLASAPAVLEALRAAVEPLESLQLDTMHQIFEDLKATLPYKAKEIMWPIRAAVSGRVAGADLQQSLVLLGRERLLARLEQARQHLASYQLSPQE